MYQAQQYYFDTAEVEAWLSEQELHMMNEEKGKVKLFVWNIYHWSKKKKLFKITGAVLHTQFSAEYAIVIWICDTVFVGL